MALWWGQRGLKRSRGAWFLFESSNCRHVGVPPGGHKCGRSPWSHLDERKKTWSPVHLDEKETFFLHFFFYFRHKHNPVYTKTHVGVIRKQSLSLEVIFFFNALLILESYYKRAIFSRWAPPDIFVSVLFIKLKKGFREKWSRTDPKRSAKS